MYLNDAVYSLELGRTYGATLDWVGPALSVKLSWGSMVTTRDRQNDPLRGMHGSQLLARIDGLDMRLRHVFLQMPTIGRRQQVDLPAEPTAERMQEP